MTGTLMAGESAEAPAAFARAAWHPAPAFPGDWRALYTVARGSSDAAALVLAYEWMREAGRPATTLPPSVFSLGNGVDLAGALVLVISQSGASPDLVLAAQGARARGARVVAVTNVDGSAVERAAHARAPILAGEERAVPATKSVAGAIGAGLALLARAAPLYAPRLRDAARSVAEAGRRPHPRAAAIRDALLAARSVYVIGRDCGWGAATEVALKLKETCALHAEAYSASEVLHGPLRLAGPHLTALVLDAGHPESRASLDLAAERLVGQGARVLRVAPADVAAGPLTPAAGAALLLCCLYPIIREAALARGLDPDAPAALSKVTRTT